ncbi:MAG: hypothetical protein WB630_00540, partial [Candidatus Acidiferrales bacterium]
MYGPRPRRKWRSAVCINKDIHLREILYAVYILRGAFRIHGTGCERDWNCTLLVVITAKQTRTAIGPLTLMQLRCDIESLSTIFTANFRLDVVEMTPELEFAIRT